ncbi:SDR family oxidoreductase [Gracilibacillus oryzae]|uniref:SDR family oxidoreductase n=1 Tax=Gracilibacillus oryzae TaxID=1672701 RepID=A0A7C8GVM0_9BACI|nr:SDR family oxidoreductase [Gracilibacillus oryzae]KAB8138864.1 SDR family oxidoreductase [Gracilibacillus oryzae]
MGLGNTCLIVGASGEIGAAIALKLAADGYNLILHYNKNEDAVLQLKNKIGSRQITGIICADLSQPEGTEDFLSQLHHDIDQLVFASGSSLYGLMQDLTNEEMDSLFHLHVKSVWQLTQHVLPAMISRKKGQFVLITSIWGEVGASYEVAYSTVKGAQNSFVKALSKEVGPSGIRVNGVSPGYIETKMNQHLTDAERMDLVSEISLQKSGFPEDIAEAVSFLISKRAQYITGEILRVNGGWI